MKRLTNVCCALLLAIVLVLETVQSNSGIEKAEVEDDTEARTLKLDGGWEARAGKRKRSSRKSEDYYRSPALEREQVADFVDSADDQWTILALRGGKREYRPRLGRESGEEMSNAAPSAYNAERWYQENDLPNDLMAQRSPPFAPRLGRHLYDPRLGRRLEKLV